MSEIRVPKILRRELNGNVIFVPAQVEFRAFNDSTLTWEQIVRIHEETLKVNEPIDPAKFKLPLHKDEVLIDIDTGMTLIDPGKQIDLDSALREEMPQATSRGSKEATAGREESRTRREQNPVAEAQSGGHAIYWLYALAGIFLLIGIILAWRFGRTRDRRGGQ